MRDAIITITDAPDSVILDGVHAFEVLTTIGLVEGGDFQITLQFKNLTEDNFKTLLLLFKEPKALQFHSVLAGKEGYPISHIVVEDMRSENLSMTWQCLSDSPDYSLEID